MSSRTRTDGGQLDNRDYSNEVFTAARQGLWPPETTRSRNKCLSEKGASLLYTSSRFYLLLDIIYTCVLNKMYMIFYSSNKLTKCSASRLVVPTHSESLTLPLLTSTFASPQLTAWTKDYRGLGKSGAALLNGASCGHTLEFALQLEHLLTKPSMITPIKPQNGRRYSSKSWKPRPNVCVSLFGWLLTLNPRCWRLRVWGLVACCSSVSSVFGLVALKLIFMSEAGPSGQHGSVLPSCQPGRTSIIHIHLHKEILLCCMLFCWDYAENALCLEERVSRSST